MGDGEIVEEPESESNGPSARSVDKTTTSTWNIYLNDPEKDYVRFTDNRTITLTATLTAPTPGAEGGESEPATTTSSQKLDWKTVHDWERPSIFYAPGVEKHHELETGTHTQRV